MESNTKPLTELLLKGSDILDSADSFSIDRSKYLNASSAMTCIRRQWFERNYGEAEQDWGYARRGKQVELYVVDCLQAAFPEGDIWGVGENQRSLFCPDRKISATPDGWVWLDEEVVQLEIKSIDPRVYGKGLPRENHVTQLRIAMELAHLRPDLLPVVDGEPDYGTLIYVDASNYNLTYEYRVERDPKILDKLAPRAKLMLGSRKVGGLEREGIASGECVKYGGCPYSETCGVGTLDLGTGPTVSRGNLGSRLATSLEEYVKAKDLAEDAKTIMDAHKAKIVTEMEARGVKTLPVGNREVVLTERKGSRSYDWDAAKRAGRDDTPFTKVGKASVSLSVK